MDRAALDAAIELHIPHGGWCPGGRMAEDGTIDARYNLRETGNADYRTRTRLNVKDADATLILNSGKLDGGTALTAEFAKEFKKPCLIIELENRQETEIICQWFIKNRIQILNVAGPRSSKCPGIYDAAYKLLLELFSRLQASFQHN